MGRQTRADTRSWHSQVSIPDEFTSNRNFRIHDSEGCRREKCEGFSSVPTHKHAVLSAYPTRPAKLKLTSQVGGLDKEWLGSSCVSKCKRNTRIASQDLLWSVAAFVESQASAASVSVPSSMHLQTRDKCLPEELILVGRRCRMRSAVTRILGSSTS